jgi:outer membrane lipoprotein-sorting protein
MSPLTARRPLWRWLLPILAVVVLATAGSAVAAIGRSTHSSLPSRTPSQLLVDVQKASIDGFSGTVVQSADLGLPSLPTVGGRQSSDFSSLVSGSHTLRVWTAGPQRTRIALLGQLGESDLIRNGSDVWLWSSHTNTARHLTVPATHHTTDAYGADGARGDHAMTPQQAADAALKAITPTTRVTTGPTVQVAGRSAYELVLDPRDPATLVGSVKIAIDGATHIPTRVQVIARGETKPAFEVGFTSFNPSTPPASVFRFNPPPGAHVTQGMVDGMGPSAGSSAGSSDKHSAGTEPQLIGDGWTTVVKATLPSASGGSHTPGGNASSALGSLDSVVKQLPAVSGSWGSGHLLHGTLFSVLVTDDGHVVAGAVPPDRLYAALSAR